MAQGREGQKGKVTPPPPPPARKRDAAEDTNPEITALIDKALVAGSPLANALQDIERTPEDLAAWERLEAAAATDGRPAIALAAYRKALESDFPAAAGMALGRRAAAYQAEWLADRPGDLEEILERVLRIDPRCEWALRQLIVSMTLAQRWDALLAVYDRALGSGPDRERRVALLSEAAQVAKDFVGRQELAITYLQELFTLVPGDPQVSTVLERLLERHERWSELVAFWRARLPVVPPPEGRTLRERIALAELDRLNDPAAALVSLRALLGEKGDPERVLAALEQILALESAPAETRLGAGSALEAAYDAAGAPARALAAVERGLKFAGGASRKALLWNAAARRVAASDARTAVTLLAALMPLDPDDREVEDWFRRLCREQKLPTQLIDGLAAAAAATNDGRRRAVLRAEIATVTDAEIGDRTAAIAAYQRAWREPEGEPVTQRRILIRLDELLEAADRQAERLPVLAGLADLAPRAGREARGAGHARAPRVDAGRGQHRGRRLARLPGAGPRRRRGAGDAAARAGGRGTLGRVRRDPAPPHVGGRRSARRGGGSGARRHRGARFAGRPPGGDHQLSGPRAALRPVDRGHRRAGGSADRGEALAGSARPPGRDLPPRSLARRRAGRAPGRHLPAAHGRSGRTPSTGTSTRWSPTRATPRRATVWKRWSRSRPCARAPWRRCWPRASRPTTGRCAWACSTRAFADATTGAARAAILREAADLSETRAQNKATALAHAARALVADPDDRPTEAQLVRLATETGGFRVAVHALEESAAVAGLTPRRATELLTHAAEVHEEQLGDAAAALNDYTRALAAEPGRTDLRTAVVRCAGRSARWEPLAEALLSLDVTPDLREETLFPMAESAARANAAFVPLAAALGEISSSQSSLAPETLLSLENRIAAWHETERGDFLMAEAALVRALGHCPDDLPTLHHLAEVQRRSPAPSLYETLRRIAALATGDLDALYEATEWARDLALPDDTGLDAARALLDRAARLSASLEPSEGSKPPAMGSGGGAAYTRRDPAWAPPASAAPPTRWRWPPTRSRAACAAPAPCARSASLTTPSCAPPRCPPPPASWRGASACAPRSWPWGASTIARRRSARWPRSVPRIPPRPPPPSGWPPSTRAKGASPRSPSCAARSSRAPSCATIGCRCASSSNAWAPRSRARATA